LSRDFLAIVALTHCVPMLADETNAQVEASAKPPAFTAPATPDVIDAWVAELGHDSYGVRQEAAAQLLAAGMPAREKLLAVVEGPDPETRAAARRLIALIDRSEFQRRLDAFAADIDGRQRLSLPGWEQFQKIAGGDAAARSLFVDMQRQEGTIFSAVFGASKHAPEDIWEARLARVSQSLMMGGDRNAAPSLGTCAALVFLGSVSEMNVSDNAGNMVESLLERPPMRETIQAENHQPAARKLAINWLLNCPNKSDELLRRRLALILAMNIEDGLPLALDVIGNAQFLRSDPLAKVEAVQIVMQFGKRSHLSRLEPLLDDSTVCLSVPSQVPGQPVQTVQVRDVALVALLRMTDQSPANYGYLGIRLQPTQTFQLQSLYRESDKQRSEAIEKWRQWRAAHPNANREPAPAN